MTTYDRIIQAINAKNITQTQFMADIGISVSYLQNMKTRGSMPRGEILNRMCRYLGVSQEYLLTGEEREERTTTNNYLISEKLSEREYCILQIFRTLTDEQQTGVTELIFKFKSHNDN